MNDEKKKRDFRILVKSYRIIENNREVVEDIERGKIKGEMEGGGKNG